jgi:hypothetical protein
MRLEISDREAANCQLPVITNPTIKVTAMAIRRQVMDLASERFLDTVGRDLLELFGNKFSNLIGVQSSTFS